VLHFLIAGGVLFAAYQVVQPQAAREQSARIEISASDLRRLHAARVAQGRAPATAEELRGLLEAAVREEILYREALALGLDTDDTIIRRRLAQKMEFLLEDVAVPEPTDDELRAFLVAKAQDFALPARVTFRHLYFSPDRRGARAREDAVAVLARLTGTGRDAPSALADPFMFSDDYRERPLDEIAGTFGRRFAPALLELRPGSWHGPIESGYGWHLVWIDSIIPSRVPVFEEVARDVRSAWFEDQRAAIRQRAYEGMRGRYEVLLPPLLSAEDIARADREREIE
jgi:parvulin-like peptidyl-prolyl isomerase